MKNLTAAFAALARMPVNLQVRVPSDPEVQARMIRNVPEPSRRAGIIAVGVGFMGGLALAQFSITLGMPLAKLFVIAREGGGIFKFLGYVFTFARTGTLPSDGGSEPIELLLSVTGVGSLNACF